MAGFAEGTTSASLAGLRTPSDLFVDEIGNMHIADSSNSRILYWPINSREGRIVAGTGHYGSEANQLGWPTSFTSNDQYFQSCEHP